MGRHSAAVDIRDNRNARRGICERPNKYVARDRRLQSPLAGAARRRHNAAGERKPHMGHFLDYDSPDGLRRNSRHKPGAYKGVRLRFGEGKQVLWRLDGKSRQAHRAERLGFPAREQLLPRHRRRCNRDMRAKTHTAPAAEGERQKPPHRCGRAQGCELDIGDAMLKRRLGRV